MRTAGVFAAALLGVALAPSSVPAIAIVAFALFGIGPGLVLERQDS